MDFWLVAAVTGAGYLSKYWQNIPKDSDKNGRLLQLSSGDSELRKPESSNRSLRGLPNGMKRRGNFAKDRTAIDTAIYDTTSVDDSSIEEVASTSGNSGYYQDSSVFSVSNLQPGFSVNEDLKEYEGLSVLDGCSSNDYHFVNVLSPNPSAEEIDSNNGSARNRSSLRTKLSCGHFVKPMNSLESCLMAQLYKEHAEMKEYVLSSLPSPATPNVRSLCVTDGSRVIGNARNVGMMEKKLRKEASLENRDNVNGVPPLPRIGSLDHFNKMKAKKGKGRNGKLSSLGISNNGKDFHPQSGSSDGKFLFCLGISIGIISSLMASGSEVDKLKELLTQNENLVQDLQEELELKNSLTVKELANENEESHDISDHSITKSTFDVEPFQSNIDTFSGHGGEVSCSQKAEESSKSISNIEAELEAELERLGLNMTAQNSDRRLSDVIELDPDFSADFAQGELKVDLLGVENVSKSKSSNGGTSTSTTNHSGNYAVSPRELSLRLHELIQSKLEERVCELETALQNSQRKIQMMESKRKISEELTNGRLQFSSMHESPVKSREHNSVPRSPLVVNLSGQALAAYNEASEELMKVSDSEEEDSPRRIYEDIPCSDSLHSEFSEEKSRETFHGNARMQEEHISLVLGSNVSSNSGDVDSDCDGEDEKELIKQIVERTKNGSSVVINAQRLLFSLDENEL